MLYLKIFIWMLILASVHALQEIQIEKKGGWARRLPTFRINTFLTRLFIGKEITGYHIFMLGMFITIFHGVFLFQTWSLKNEASVFGLLSIYFIIEDFLWFVFNTKHYGIKKFKPDKIPWHKRWVWKLPLSYWLFGILGIWLIYLGIR